MLLEWPKWQLFSLYLFPAAFSLVFALLNPQSAPMHA
jgi:hypothetical protein